MTRQMKKNNEGNEWAVILAGDDGTRLKSLTRKIAGDDRPKQFCSVLGGATLLEETEHRAALEFAAERTLYVVNRHHQPYYTPILSSEPRKNLVVHPSNRGTAPAILYALLRIAARDPEAVVAFLPSDHYISDNFKFMAHVRAAVETAQRRPDLIALLGLEPESPEVEYGWIEPSAPIKGQPKCSGANPPTRSLSSYRQLPVACCLLPPHLFSSPSHLTAQEILLPKRS